MFHQRTDEKVEERCFPGTGWAKDGTARRGRNCQREVRESRRSPVAVLEREMFDD